MKKIAYFLLLFTGISQAQIAVIPDANFKAALLSADVTLPIAADSNGSHMKIDTNSDGNIQVSEALNVYELNVSYSVISNLAGIEYFTNLRSLNISNNSIPSLNLSALANLEVISFNQNPITSLDITACANLKELTAFNVPLTSLNVTGLANLEVLNLQNAWQLTTLNTTGLSGLKHLVVNNAQITGLDFSGLTSLEKLWCSGNNMTTLDVTPLTGLQELMCSNNEMTSLNVTGLTNLKQLIVNTNQLTTLELEGLDSLELLYCSQNLLTSLDLTGLPNLHSLACWENQLTALDFSAQTSFDQSLFCADNLISTVDLSGVDVRLAEQIDFSNNGLISLIVKNGFTESDNFNLTGNPDLAFICVDEGEAGYFQGIVDTNGYNAVVNSYCSFVPGGDYNTITGTLQFDMDNNGCTADDIIQPFMKVKINDGNNNNGANFTGAAGSYAFYTGAGTFTVSPDFENIGWFSVSPQDATVNFPAADGSVATQNFCVTANGIHSDAEVLIAPIIPARPGFDAVYKIVCKNKGNQIVNGSVIFNFEEPVMDVVNSVPPPQDSSPGVLLFSLVELLPFESRDFLVTMHVNGPTDTPAVNINDILDLTAEANVLSATDETPVDNVFQFHQTVIGSFDPNNKLSPEGEVVSPVMIGEYLHYSINFENTGTAPAENVVVLDMIDESQFDVSTLQVLSSSDAVSARITGNKVEFFFYGIYLETGGHGNILLKVKTKDALQAGDMVANEADIFFDYNAPVETLPAETTFESLGIDTPDANLVAVYPNPAQGIVNVRSASTIRSVQLYDIQGRLLQTRLNDTQETTIDIASRAIGVYFLKTITDNGTAVNKIIKE